MQFALVLLTSLLISSCYAAAAAPTKWEICLDKADFNFSVDGFMGSISAKKDKDSCLVTFGVSGGKGQRYIVDLCDPSIHLDYYDVIAVEPSHLHRYYAGTAGCPAPLFGADFDENAKEYNDYKEARKSVLGLFDKVKESYGEGSDKIDLSNANSFSPEVSAGKVACGQYLIREYLVNCMSFEGKKQVPKEGPEPLIPGVHPKTIMAPK